jgi:hypothetical protein
MKWDKKIKEELEYLKPVTDEEFEELLDDKPRKKRGKRGKS